MDLFFDRTGFSYVVLKKLALAVSLLPLTKLQFEQYLADVKPQRDGWYEELLALNPSVSPQNFTTGQREQLFVTGLLPSEAEAYAAWLGEGYRLPTVEEWRTIYRCFQSIDGLEHQPDQTNLATSGFTMLNQSPMDTARYERSLPNTIGPTEIRDGKPIIRYFVSYAHKDKILKDKLLNPLKQLLATAKDYCFKAWDDGDLLAGEDWHDKIRSAVDYCHFGLLLVSPAFLGSEFIKDHELPAFVSHDLAVPETEKRAIPVALKPILFDGIMDLKGLEKLQIFHNKNGKAFHDLNSDRTRDEFALELFQQIIKIVNRYGTPSPIPNPQITLNEEPDINAQAQNDVQDPITSPSQQELATILLRRLQDQAQSQSLLDLSLLRGGLVEWVRDGDAWKGLGAPRHSFKPNLWNPLSDTVQPIRTGQRLEFFGVRLVREMEQSP
ncbi:MAG: hypothetical protein DM484_30465 [Candidatus Methylumidiphilus alinenensis]|uniref:TIR domain-containing protein n=1 Tax=Candidatus Methylumidiphilus alinenensis TaxID=2202197 RepID=A0A2W4RYV4_9GAMM|nr:MAG: hypothetical protein DM484_30465 [Candidatus Methylumidiphilus alinenensis]